MRTYMIYLLLTGKRLLRQLPYFLAGLAVMVLLIGMAAFSASKVLYGETSLKKIEVGVVLPEDDALSEKITKMIASLDSVESLCDFSYLEHDEAFQKMKSGELQAVFEVPSGMARGILDRYRTSQPRSGFRMREGWKALFSGNWQSRAVRCLALRRRRSTRQMNV